MTPRDIARFIEARRFPINSEKALQSAMAEEFERSGIVAKREVNLGDGCIIDFLIGEVGVEVKIKGQRREIYRQCERYCEHERIASLVLVTNAAMGMPQTLHGKPAMVVYLGKAWFGV